jgi:hypothetical protein
MPITGSPLIEEFFTEVKFSISPIKSCERVKDMVSCAYSGNTVLQEGDLDNTKYT